MKTAYALVVLKQLKDGTYSGWHELEYYHLDSNSLFIESGDVVKFYKKST